jgi:hypothetical protein
VGPRAGLNRCEKFSPHQDSIPGPSSPEQVAIPTELPGPLRYSVLPINSSLLTITLHCLVITTLVYKVNGKGKGHPRTGHKGPEGELRYSSTLSLTSSLDGVGG